MSEKPTTDLWLCPECGGNNVQRRWSTLHGGNTWSWGGFCRDGCRRVYRSHHTPKPLTPAMVKKMKQKKVRCSKGHLQGDTVQAVRFGDGPAWCMTCLNEKLLDLEVGRFKNAEVKWADSEDGDDA